MTDYIRLLQTAADRTREAAFGVNPCADTGDKTKNSLRARAQEWEDCATELQSCYNKMAEAKKAADAILAPLTAEVGRLLEENPNAVATITCFGEEIELKAVHFMDLYKATE